MNKESFLEKLREKLSILESSEVDDILEEYSDHIDEKIKDGASESDAIKEFGNIDELVKDILSAYKINYKKDKVESFIDEVVYSAKEVFEKILKILTHGSANEIVKLIISIILILILIGILKIPFDIIEGIINNIFEILPDTLERTFCVIVNVFINVSYAIISIILLIKMLQEKLLVNYVFKEEIKAKDKIKTKTKKDNTKNEDKVEEKIVYRKDNSFFDFITNTFLLMIKIFVAFALIPCVFGIVGSSVGIAGLILFSIKYYMFLGPIIICLGTLLGCIWLTEIIFRFISSKKGSFLKSFLLFVSALILFGIGIGISVMEVSNLKYENEEIEQLKLNEYDFNTDTFNNITCDDCSRIEKEIDNTIPSNKYKVYVYGTEFDKSNYYNSYNENEKKLITFYYSLNDSKRINGLIEDIKNGRIINYEHETRLYEYRFIKIVGSEETLSKINTILYEE